MCVAEQTINRWRRAGKSKMSWAERTQQGESRTEAKNRLVAPSPCASVPDRARGTLRGLVPRARRRQRRLRRSRSLTRHRGSEAILLALQALPCVLPPMRA